MARCANDARGWLRMPAPIEMGPQIKHEISFDLKIVT
jgi:hypothetical protein